MEEMEREEMPVRRIEMGKEEIENNEKMRREETRKGEGNGKAGKCMSEELKGKREDKKKHG